LQNTGEGRRGERKVCVWEEEAGGKIDDRKSTQRAKSETLDSLGKFELEPEKAH